MLFKTEERKFTTKTVEKDLTFPYFGWWSGKRDYRIMRAELQYYPAAEWNKFDPPIQRINVTIVTQKGFNVDPQITTSHYHVSNNIIPQDYIAGIANDYDDTAKKEDFHKIFNDTVKVIRSQLNTKK